MSITTLDVARLRRSVNFKGPGGSINLGSIIKMLRLSVEDLAHQGLLDTSLSFGVAVGKPTFGRHVNLVWDDPYALTDFVGGWGPDRDECIANGVRKLRAVQRTGRSTLDIRRNEPDLFRDKVESVEDDGSFRWGDFPYGGGALVDVGGIIIPIGVSALLEVEDHAEALHIGGLIGSEMLKRMEPDQFGPGT